MADGKSSTGASNDTVHLAVMIFYSIEGMYMAKVRESVFEGDCNSSGFIQWQVMTLLFGKTQTSCQAMC